MATPLIDARAVSYAIRGAGPARPVLREASIEVAPGELVALTGPLGAGKTTLLLAIAGLLRPDAGAVRLDEEDVWSASATRRRELRRGLLALVPAGGALAPDRSLAEQIELPLRLAGMSRRDRGARVGELLDQAGLVEAVARRRPYEVGTDERRLAAVARALAPRPRIVLADEPTAGASAAASEAVLRLLAPVTGRQGALLLATDDAELAARADRALALVDGAVQRARGVLDPGSARLRLLDVPAEVSADASADALDDGPEAAPEAGAGGPAQ